MKDLMNESNLNSLNPDPLNPPEGDFKSRNNKKIAIITDWSEDLGSGHIQRMATLAKVLYELENITIRIINNKDVSFLKNFPQDILKEKLDGDEDLIIRDQRDSSFEQISHLKKIAKTIVIDDNGEGRNIAFSKIDFLPNIKYDDAKKFSLIYGYNFLESLNELQGKTIAKEIDVVVYAGFNPSDEKLSKLISLIPKNCDYIILNGKNSYSYISGIKNNILDKSYAEYILSSKILISHFGITLYEAELCKTKSIVINPSKYHSKLTDRVVSSLNLINLGILENLDINYGKEIISEQLNLYSEKEVFVGDILEKIENSNKKIVEFVLKLIKK